MKLVFCLVRRRFPRLNYSSKQARYSTMSAAQVHEMAKAGFGSGTNELYDRARPSYQPNALSLIRKAVSAKTSVNIVELGAGTGIFTRALLAHPEWQSSIGELRAVEPSEGMREVFTKTVTDSRASVANGTFDSTGVPDAWADLIVIAQAFHWCPDHDAALQEFARALKPNGVVVLIWNLEDREKARWVAELRDIYEKFEKGTPQFRLGLWRKVFDVPSYAKFFKPHEETVLSHTIPATVDSVADRVFSKSYIAVLPDEEKQKVRQDVKAIVEKGEDKVWINEEQGLFHFPYQTFVVVLPSK
ncbi:S-adenosyl-L-methionine-dependent methyltransferase [Phellopilus nigrolimitatus]|nr:S-adenosyl-L-methionine-dependent methyltransferase [Phellopilus nigrolimitatus]